MIDIHIAGVGGEAYWSLAVGDFDGDFFEEIAVRNAYITADYIYNVTIIDDLNQPNQTESTRVKELPNSDILSRGTNTFISCDVDGDNYDEILMFGYLGPPGAPLGMMGLLYKYNSSSNDYYLAYSWTDDRADFIHAITTLEGIYSTTGDLDCDGRDEIIYSDYVNTVILDDISTDFAFLFYSTDVLSQTSSLWEFRWGWDSRKIYRYFMDK